MATAGYIERNGILRPRADYDAVDGEAHKRKSPRVYTQSEDDELTPTKRRKMNASARDQQRNFALAAWMLRKHLDYVSRHAFQSKSGDRGLDAALEDHVDRLSRARRFDTFRRHDRSTMTRLAEGCAVVDGDSFWMHLRSGTVQGLEGDRIAKPRGATYPDDVKSQDISKHGIVFRNNRPSQWCVCKRDGRRRSFERLVPDWRIQQHAYVTRYDQWRGVSPLSTAINSLQDVYEALDYNLIKAKLHALFGVAITREGMVEGLLPQADEDADVDSDDDTIHDEWKKFKPGVAGLFDLPEGADIQTIESKSPSGEFQNFVELIIHIALLALDIPFTFWDSRASSFSARIGDNLQYIASTLDKRERVHRLLNGWLRWRLGLSIYRDKEFTLPSGMELDDLQWEWHATAPYPWADPLKEIKFMIEAVKHGFMSRQQACKLRGVDWFDIVDQLAVEQDYLEEKGVQLESWTSDYLAVQET